MSRVHFRLTHAPDTYDSYLNIIISFHVKAIHNYKKWTVKIIRVHIQYAFIVTYKSINLLLVSRFLV